MHKQANILVAGAAGLVGSAICRRLEKDGFTNILAPAHAELDLTNPDAVSDWFKQHKPDYVFMAAAKVGGILANNTYRGEFIRDNLLIQTNVIDAARRSGVERLLFLGSSCIYPRECPQPMREDHLLTGPLEPTNEPYAIAKIAGIKMCEAFNAQYGTRYLSVMPTNLYGPGDNFDLETSHVLPAFIHKFHRAKEQGDGEVVMWGTGSPRREFLYVDDLADACVYLLEETDEVELTNIGVGKDISIRELAELVADVVGFDGEIVNDASKPDGTPRKLLNVNKLNELGWEAKVELRGGIARTYDWFVANWNE
jgi:GDP-L-fucose synthase